MFLVFIPLRGVSKVELNLHLLTVEMLIISAQAMLTFFVVKNVVD